ncbi:uncharacterized protein LOC124111176 [Haliotis rufescens]|uniref:uncharacterized protein LOC124111176 n=1 Tax=Haliotis rufescens TaxID=6454 RepID=UPI00201F771D|nr:uncharacterized protein LOC124111176 [Haliotis rufescens]
MSGLRQRTMIEIIAGFVAFLACVNARFINFIPGFEYQYKFNSKADVKSIGEFHIAAKVGYTNIREDDEGQEVSLRVYTLALKTKHSQGVAGHDWDFSRWFSFVITPHGEIVHVYHPADDDDEAVAIKKGLSAVFAGRLHHESEEVSRRTEAGWRYSVQETGQEGVHQASYSVRPSKEGHIFTKTRDPKGHPVKHASSQYTKTLYYSKDLGNIHSVEINETFQAMHKVQDGYEPFENSRPVKAVNEFTNIEYPELSALGTGKLEFLTRYKLRHVPSRPVDAITRASVFIDKVSRKKPDSVVIKDEMKFITSNLTCMRNEPDKGSKRLTKCFMGILACLKVLPDGYVDVLAKKYLSPNPRRPRDVKDRNHVFDAIAALNTVHTQRVLLDTVLNVTSPNAFLVKRLLMHIVTMETPPIDDIISKLEDLCFRPDGAPSQLQEGDTHHRMVLAIGVVAKRLWTVGRKQEASQIVRKIESLLGLHDPWLYRHKRALMTEAQMLADDHWRVVLVESLGNAALDQSFDYIVSHVNDTNSQWVKRAGIHAMRKYDHDSAANLMMKTALFDEDDKVRFEALLQYQAHPRAANVAAQYMKQGLVNGSIFYQNPSIGSQDIQVLDRHKRGILDETIEFLLQAPGVNWKKLLGSTKIGASFGVNLENLLDFKIAPLDGHAKLTVHDEAYAMVHLGVLGLNVDFFRARLCFKGSASYNLNLLQEFDIDSIRKLVELYDKIKGDVVDAIEVGVDLFKGIIRGDPSIGEMLDEFKQALEEMPQKVVEVGKKSALAMAAMGEIDEEQLPPFIRPTRNLIVKVTNLYKDIKSAVMTFYNTLMETITVVIPRAGEQIFKSIKTIVDGFKNFNNDPKQAISGIAGNVITIGMEVKNLVEAINKTKQACFFLKKEKPYWWDLRGQISEIRAMASNATSALRTGGSAWVNEVVKGQKDPIAEFTKGKTTMAEQKQEVIDIVKGIVDDLLAPLDGLKNLGGKFVETYEKVFKVVQDIKEAFDALREGYRTARSLIDRVFGPKCHKTFPRTLRQPGGGCDGAGSYPSTLKNGKPEYENAGADITIMKGKDVVAPFPGIIMLSNKPNEVIVMATGGSLKNTEIIITNVKPNSTIQHPSDGLYVDNQVVAGQVIGAASESECGSSNHIHFAMRRPDGPVDPTRFLEPRIPEIPKWIQECDDYKLVWKFETVAAGSVIGLLGKDQNDTSPERQGEKIENPPNVDPDKDPSKILSAANDQPGSMYQKQKTKKTEIENKAGKTNDTALKALFKKPAAFMKKFSVRNLKLGALLGIMDILGLDESQQKMADVIKLIKEMIDNKPCFNPSQLTDDQLRTELTERGQRADGTREQMITRITTPQNKCPAMKIGMPKNIYCTFDSMCLGLECCAHFKLFMFRKAYKVYARLDPCEFQFVVGVEKKFEKTFGALDGLKDIVAGFDKTLKTGIKLNILGGIELVVKVRLEKDEFVSLITLGAGFCALDDSENCIAFFNILDEAPTPLPICLDDGTMRWPEIDYKSLFDKEAIRKRIREKGSQLVKDTINKGIEEVLSLVPCISKTAPGKSSPCHRPETFTQDLLKQSLQERGLAVSGTKTQLEQRLRDADKQCTVLGKTLTLPAVRNPKLDKIIYMSISSNCLRVDACVDAEIKAIGFNKAFKAHIELDPCRFTLVLNFETCTHEVILFGYAWGTPSELKLSDEVVIRYTIDRDETRKVFIVTMGLKLGIGAEPILDSTFLENFDVPIPLCNENFSLPGTGSIKDLARKMGGKIIGEVVDVIFKKLKLDTVFSDGPCSLGASPADCPWELPNITSYLPSSFRDKVTCGLPENCFGVQCCVDFVFNIPLFDQPLLKSVPFFLKFEPCNFTVEVGFGSYYHKETLLEYNWGSVTALEIGDGDPAPIIISFSISKYSQGFIIDLSVTTCIPIDDESFCFPDGGLQLMKGERIPACDAKALVEFSKQNFSLSEWTKELGLDAAQALSQSAARLLLDKFGIAEFLKEERCDVQREPYTPSVDGWRNECPKSIRKLPKLPSGLHCHLAATCTKIDCCFDVPFLKMSFNAILNVDMCDYFIFAAVEKKNFTFNMLGDNVNLDTGVSTGVTIEDVFIIDFGLKKQDKMFLLDLKVQVCFESDNCMIDLPVMTGTEVPQLICDLDAKVNLKNFSLSDWAKAKGQDLGQGLAKAAVSLLLEQLGIKDKMLEPPCARSSLKYQPADADNWKNDCPLVNSAFSLPKLTIPANCYINDRCLGIDCCMQSNLLDLSLHTTFTIDLCNFYIEGSIEKYSFRFNILDYKWGTETEVTIEGIPVLKMNFKIERILSQQMFIVDLTASLCLQGGDCELDLKIFDQSQLPMPGCAPIQGFKIPDFSLNNWLKERGGEITAALSAVLLKELGVDKFLLNDPCETYVTPYKGAIQGWKNDCPENLTLPVLPSNVVCYVSDFCTGISCCAKVPQIRRNFNAHLFIDSCNFFMSVGIEKLEFSHTLFEYDWGKTEEIDIGGVFRAEFSIQNLPGEKKFLVNLQLKVCLTAGADCQFTLPIFVDMLVPKPFCDWDATKQLKDFSLTEFVSTQGAQLSDKLSGLLVDKLLDTLGLASYLQDTQCSLAGRGATGWNSACPLDITFPTLPDTLSCSVPEHCTAIDCCLDVPLISKNVGFKVDLDMCRMTLTLGIERLEFRKMLFKYSWGTPDSFNLKGVFRADFIIDHLEGEKQFLVSLNISACFEAGKACMITVPVVSQARFPNPLCDWNATKALKGFSLGNWLSQQNIGMGSLTSLLRSQLAEALGISQYLLEPMCNKQAGIYKADSNGWNMACPRNLTLPSLPDSLSCHIPDYCTGLDCCVTAAGIGMSFNAKILLNTCDYVLTVGIENLVFKTALFNYKWGEWEQFNLNGVVRIEFKIDDLKGERKFLVSLNVSLCFEAESTCLLSVPIITEAKFPKILCNWEDKLSLRGFSLKTWLAERGSAVGAQVTGVLLSKLLDELQITEYLKDPQCQRDAAPYAGAVGGWKKDCPASLTLPSLPSGVTCHLSDPCGTVECCIFVGFIGRSFNVKIGIDPCTYTFTMGIEKLVFTRALFTYRWGQIEHFTLKGVIRADFMIDELFGEKKFLINLNVSVCFEEDSCLLSFPVLKDVKIPKLLCDWDSTVALKDFSLDNFLEDLKVTDASKLSSAISSQLLEQLGVGSYLRSPQCDSTSNTYLPAVKGWRNECPIPGLDTFLPDLPNAVACHVSDICTAIDCCITIDFLSRSFNIFLTVDMCTYQLTVGVENFVYKRMLFNYTWGTPDHFYIKGVFRIDYTINKLPAERKLEVSATASVCLKESDCLFTQQLLNKARIPQPLCDWKGMLQARKFSLSSWSVGKGLSSAVSSLTDSLVSQLLDDLGVSQYFLASSCDQGASPYSPSNIHNWNKACSSLTVPTLPNSVKCHLAASCSALDCCVNVPLIKRTIQAKFDVDICALEITMSIEKLSYKLSLLQYTWGVAGDFILGSMTRISYKIDHVAASKKLVVDLSIKVCFEDNSCLLEVPVFSQSEIVYAPCDPSLPVPFKGVSFDFWKSEPCTRPAAPAGCSVNLPASIANTCQLTDNCMGVTCCVDIDLKYLGIYSVSAGIMADHCSDQLRYHIENKQYTKNLNAITYDKNFTEPIGNAIAISYLVSKTPSSYQLSLHVKICALNGYELTDTCFYYTLMDKVTFPMPSCAPLSRRKRSVIAITDSRDPRELLNKALDRNATNEDLYALFDELQQLEEADTSMNLQYQDTDGAATNTKTALKEMGSSNPGTLLYSGEVANGDVTVNMEGGEKIMQILGNAKDIAGRVGQAFTVGKGLTGSGVKLLGAKLANMTIGQVIAMFDTKNIDPEQALQLTRKLRDLALALYSEILNAIINGEAGEAFKSFDLTLQGSFGFPRISVMFFEYEQFFLVGGLVPMTFGWGAGASYGMDIVVGAKILGMTAFGTVIPYANAHVYGEIGIGAVLYGKLRLDGYIMTVAFPSTAEIGFSKFPLDLALTMDLELTPIELVLRALVTLEIKIPFIGRIKKTLFSKKLWRYATPTIRKKMIDVGKKEKDESPPQFLQYVDKTGNSRSKRAASTTQCSVRQLPERDYTQPAIEIAVQAQDDRSQVELFLDAGTKPGLSDVLKKAGLGGPSTIITQRFSKHGVPMYFTVFGENSAGVRSEVTCNIPTYDVTLPGGRLTADFKSTSSPSELRASVVVYEDSDLTVSNVGVGLGRGIYGDEVIAFNAIDLKTRNNKAYDASTDPVGHVALERFTGLKDGRLTGPVIATFTGMNHAGKCAKECMKYLETKCLSFNYDYGVSGECELLEAIEGHDYRISSSGRYTHYERLGVGLAYEFIYKDLSLRHQAMYFFNLHIINSLMFENILHSRGIVVDLTPPEPGPVANVTVDMLEVTLCKSVVPDDRPDWEERCRGIDGDVKNHRTLHDGPGSMTLFNGDEPLTDLLYTRANRYVASNWDGIMDKESGILGYSWTVGRQVCEELIHPHHDPHRHLFDQSEWTNSGLITALPDAMNPLPDGKYYITLRALNNVEYGGPLVTTICHTTPLGIDNTQPFVHEVYDVEYDEDTYVITAKYNASDPESDIREVDLCLGQTTRDCYHLEWQRSNHSDHGITRTFQIPGGIPVWVKVRAINHVDLMRVGVADHPIVIDTSPPIAGTVYDGPVYKHDLNFTKDADKICANWFNFYDPESGISHYEVIVLSDSGIAISQPFDVDHKVHETCVDMPTDQLLEHSKRYTVSVTAFNAGHKQLNVTSTSDGVIVDLTPPVAGEVVDGRSANFTDTAFSLHVATVATQWRGYTDPESNIREYAVEVLRARNLSSDFEVLRSWRTLSKDTSEVEWHNFRLSHRDVVKTKLQAVNNALGSIEDSTNGFVVDLTPPRMAFLGDGSDAGRDADFQFSASTVEANFRFYDDESGIDHFKYQVYQRYHGNKHQIHPETGWNTVTDPLSTSVSHSGLDLKPGALYSIRVGAVNKAGAVATYDTNGVLLDNSKPEMKWVYVGIFSGSSEELINGYVIQSDNSGIMATWFATDHESGISSYAIAVGTTEGGTDVLNWMDVGAEKDKYLSGLTLTVTDPGKMTPLYYVTVKATNGAGQTSDVITSNPIRVVEEDKPGVAIDGADSTETASQGIGVDIDYQKDVGVMTVQFAGFESQEHGVTYYDWAVGTTPGGEEVQPFIKAGLVHEEKQSNVPGSLSHGFGQAVLPLVPGISYYTTIRGITNAGNILESTSDGIVVDQTPPAINFESFGSESNKSLLMPSTLLYQTEVDSMATSWRVADSESPVKKMFFSVGTYPHGQDVQARTEVDLRPSGDGALPTGVSPNAEGKSNIVTLIAENELGLTSSVVSPSLVIDTTPPTEGVLKCPGFIQPLSALECTWEGFYDTQSKVRDFTFTVGSHEGLEDVLAPVKLAGHVNKYLTYGLSQKATHGQTYYAKVTATNIVGMTVSAISNGINVDNTHPTQGTVVELGSAYVINVTDAIMTERMNPYSCDSGEECMRIDATCQESLSTVLVAWAGFTDEETGIVRYEIAVGNTPGGGQLRPFFEVADMTKKYMSVTGLALKGQRQIFVTVKATNGAGLSTVSTSNGIYVSYLSQGQDPITHLGVLDGGTSDGDLDFQASLSSMSAQWDVSGDPCPVRKYEWAIQRADGHIVQAFVDTEGRTYGTNDELEMKNKERYYQLLRVTNALNYTYMLRSNGITIEEDPLLPGQVNDGDVVGFDLEFFRTKTKISANWNNFGSDTAVGAIIAENVVPRDNARKSSSQEVVYYEVAVGTDRRFPKTRDNIVPFTNVGLNKTATFFDLDLTPVTAFYYFTVRAHSSSGSKAEVTSNGFSVGFDGGVTAGTIEMKDFINTNTVLEVPWDGFESKIGMMMYYVALSNNTDALEYKCGQFTERGSLTDETLSSLFNVIDIQNVGTDTYKKFDNLTLAQNGEYYAWVIGADKAGECNMTYQRFRVDITPPTQGKIRTGPYYDLVASYASSSRSLHAYWKDYSDEESGLRCYHVSLVKRATCQDGAVEEVVVPSIEIEAEYHSYKFMDISMERDTPYIVRLMTENNARLRSITDSPPALYDNSVPTPGRIVDGVNFTKDISWIGTSSEVKGTFLHHPVPDISACPVRPIKFNDAGWKFFESNRNFDSRNTSLSLTYGAAYVHRTDSGDSMDIKLTRDTKKDAMMSGSYFRDADLVNGGIYEFSIKSAKGDGKVVTSVLFWDGPEDYILDYDYTPTPAWEDSNCGCCYVDPVPTSCKCNCTKYIEAKDFYKSLSKRSVDGDDPAAEYEVVKLTKEEKEALKKTDSITDGAEVAHIKREPRSSCGLQIFAGGDKPGRLVAWCKFADLLNEAMVDTRDLSVDPSISYHDYNVNFFIQRPEARDSELTWCMTVHMDGELISEQCGIPHLSPQTKLYMGVWNHKNYIPETGRDAEGKIQVWSTEASFRGLVMPPEKDKLCRYGDPFKGGNNAIIRYEAAIGSATGLSDMVDFQPVHTPCIPCLKPCDVYTCDTVCDSSTTNQVVITLTNLSLPETSLVNNEFKPVIHYLTVKAVLGSGASAIASSDGFYVDTTPPDFDEDVLLYFDVSQGEFTPVKYQGSNDTIKAVWKCNDNESEVVDYSWSIGTTPGGMDIMEGTSSGENPGAIQSGLPLEHNTTYYISVNCTNGGGLKTNYVDTKGVTVLLEPPLSEDVNTTIEGAEPLGETVVPPNSMKTMDQNSVSASWTVSPDESVRRYDFCVGSSETSIDNIFPCTWVGYNMSGTVTVKDGFLKVDDIIVRKLSEYRPDYNDTVNHTDSTAFTMPPGTEMFIFMKLCNEAELCTKKLLGSSVVETDKSTLATSTNGSSITASVGGSGSTRKKRATGDVTVQTPDGLLPGQSIVLTQLTKEDLEKEYRSDASTEYVPYITNPATSMPDPAFLDRVLRQRVNYSDTDISFSVTSVGGLAMPGPLSVTFPFDPDNQDDVAMLLHWDPAQQKWFQSNTTCRFESDTEVRDSATSQITVKVCNTRTTKSTSSARRRRSVSSGDTFFSHETHFVVTNVRASIPNDPPQLTSTTLVSMEEDSGTLIYQLSAVDPDGDTVKFKINPSSDVASTRDLTLTPNGFLTFTPALNYYGTFDVPVILYEVDVVDISPASTNAIITIQVTADNDAPSVFAFSGGVSLVPADPTAPIMTLIEQNLVNDSSITYKWVFGAYDVDPAENLTLYFTQPGNGTLVFDEVSALVPNCSAKTAGILCSNLSLPHAPDAINWIYRTFQYIPETGYTGYDEVRMYTQDKGGVYSDVVTVKFAVMARPCQNDGTCSSRNESLYTCTDQRRAENFDRFYTCACAPGWTGSRCELDVNECSSGPCSWPYTCYNDVNRYFCACPENKPNCDGLESWMIGLIVLAVILLVIISVLAWYIFMVKRGRLKWNWFFMRLKGRAGSQTSSEGKDTTTAFVNKAYEDFNGDECSLDEPFRQRSGSGASWVIFSGRPDPTTTSDQRRFRFVPSGMTTPVQRHSGEQQTQNPYEESWNRPLSGEITPVQRHSGEQQAQNPYEESWNRPLSGEISQHEEISQVSEVQSHNPRAQAPLGSESYINAIVEPEPDYFKQ